MFYYDSVVEWLTFEAAKFWTFGSPIIRIPIIGRKLVKLEKVGLNTINPNFQRPLCLWKISIFNSEIKFLSEFLLFLPFFFSSRSSCFLCLRPASVCRWLFLFLSFWSDSFCWVDHRQSLLLSTWPHPHVTITISHLIFDRFHRYIRQNRPSLASKTEQLTATEV